MGGANGSRECAPDDKLRDIHQLLFVALMGFAKGSTHPTYYVLGPLAAHPSRSSDGSSGRSLTGSNGVRSVLTALPSAISSASASPVAAALRMPQTWWPVAT